MELEARVLQVAAGVDLREVDHEVLLADIVDHDHVEEAVVHAGSGCHQQSTARVGCILDHHGRALQVQREVVHLDDERNGAQSVNCLVDGGEEGRRPFEPGEAVGLGRHDRREAESQHREERAVALAADVDGVRLALEGQDQGCGQVAQRQTQAAGDVVAGSHGDQRQLDLRPDERVGDLPDRPVAAHDGDPLLAALDEPARQLGGVARPVGDHDAAVETPASDHAPQPFHIPGALPMSGPRVGDDHHGRGAVYGGNPPRSNAGIPRRSNPVRRGGIP